MGGNHSRTRKLTVENDDPSSVIKVSDDVVNRLRNSQATRDEQPIPAPEAMPAPVIQNYGYEPSSSITTVQLRQSNAEQISKNNQYWENRLKNLQMKHRQIDEILDFEYKNALDELENKKKNPYSASNPPCQEAKEVLFKCYKEHSDKPMKCDKAVQEFQECVDLKRYCLITN